MATLGCKHTTKSVTVWINICQEVAACQGHLAAYKHS